MKIRCVILAFVWMVSAATLVFAQAPKTVSVAAGDLGEAVESLARQCGVDVIYSSSLVKGQKTPGVTGTLAPAEAFRKLLEGTALDVRAEGEALLITTAAGGVPQPGVRVGAPTLAAGSANPIDQVTIEAQRKESLSTLREQLNALEDRFYAAYNKVNDIPDYEVQCRREGSARVHVCRISLKQTCTGSIALFTSGGTGGDGTAVNSGAEGSSQLCTLWLPPADYRKHMADLVAQHPELLQLLKERSALLTHYLLVRKEKFDGKVFVWD